MGRFEQRSFICMYLNINICYTLCGEIDANSQFTGKSRARDAAMNAIQSPLLDVGIERATGIVWNITGGADLTLFEVNSIVFRLLTSLLEPLICASSQ